VIESLKVDYDSCKHCYTFKHYYLFSITVGISES